jgi:hypothetical protein
MRNIEERRRMRIRGVVSLVLCVILAVSSAMFLGRVRAEESSTTTIFTDPLSVQTTSVGQTFVVNINVSNIVDLYGWQAGMTFNPEVLECTGFYEGEFLKRSQETTTFMLHYKDMNNTLGIVYYRGETLLGPVPGINGSGQLAYATFRSIGIGVSDFHLTDVILVNSHVEQITFDVKESLTIPLSGTNYGVTIVDNLTGQNSPLNPPLSGMFSPGFNVSEKEVSFAAVSIETWFCRLSVPKTLLNGSATSGWSVKVDGASVPYTATENATDTSLYFEHAQGSHLVEVIGTGVATGPTHIPGLPLTTIMLIAFLGLAGLILALLDLRKTRKALKYTTWSPPTTHLIKLPFSLLSVDRLNRCAPRNAFETPREESGPFLEHAGTGSNRF